MDTEYQELPVDSSPPTVTAPAAETIKRQRQTIIIFIIAIFIALAILIVSLIFLFHPNTTPVTVARIRDVFIIVMAVESLFVSLALVILMIQLARLINLLQTEVKPILNSTNETINNLRGTTVFLSTNLTEPVIKLNEYLAGFQKITELLGLKRKK